MLRREPESMPSEVRRFQDRGHVVVAGHVAAMLERVAEPSGVVDERVAISVAGRIEAAVVLVEEVEVGELFHLQPHARRKTLHVHAHVQA